MNTTTCDSCGFGRLPGTACPNPNCSTNKTTPRRGLRLVLGLLALLVVLAGCTGTSADTVSRNLSTDADEFKVERQIVLIDTQTNEALTSITGLCSLERDTDLVVTCRKAPGEYEKHYFGLRGMQVTYVSTQLRTLNVDRYQTKIVFRPKAYVPDFDLSVSEQ